MRRALLLSLAVSLVVAAPAAAAPDRTGTVRAESSLLWDGGPVTGSPLQTVDDDDTLVTITEAGLLTVKTSEPDDTTADIDVYIFASNEKGDALGTSLSSNGATDSAEETATATVSPGRYLIRVEGYAAVEGTYKGKATLTPSAPAGPGPTSGDASTPPPAGSSPITSSSGGSQPTSADDRPVPAIARLAKSIARRKLTGFKGTASDDGGVARVEVALVKVKKGSCSVLNATGAFLKLKRCAPRYLAARGTTAWSYRIRKRFTAGTYVLYVRATDSAGQSAVARTAFSVR